ncbi:MAG: acyltransferase family protein, partial [Pseudonocardiaceae bacterium]
MAQVARTPSEDHRHKRPRSASAERHGKGFRPDVEGLRAIAVVLVLLFHAKLAGVPGGFIGVDVFFVISGFLITGILLDTRKRERCLRDFYVRRVLRIFPIYYASLAFFTVILWTQDTVRSERMLANMPWFWTYLQNYLIAFRGWSFMLPIAHFWSLAIEEQFYMVWPLLVVRLRDSRLLVICAVAAVFSCVLRQFDVSWPYAYMFTFTRLEGLMLGAALAMLIRTHRSLLERAVPYTLPISSLGLAIVAWTQRGFHISNEWVIRAGYPLMAVFFGSILLVALDE